MSTENLDSRSNLTLAKIIAIAKTKQNKNIALQIGTVNTFVANQVQEKKTIVIQNNV